ncbi:hypothetical protein C8Q80DRAFT_77935 [Daedaleopsis nitida]|nr:hypothetical protein C8Q80DRAFT_77935 [Daedaleopsis nitida]
MEQQRSAEKGTMNELEARLLGYKAKNRELKSDVTQLANILDPMIERLEEKTLQLANDRKRLVELELEVEATKTNNIKFDLRSFIAGKNKPKDHTLPSLGSLKPFVSSAQFSCLPVAMQPQYHALELLILSDEDSVGCKSGIQRIVHFLPTQTYDPTAHNGNGGWAETSLARTAQEGGQGRQWEVIFRRKNQWLYYGTYACAGFSTSTDVEAFSYSSKISRSKLKRKTVAHIDQVAPVVCNFIATLYEDGKTGPTSFVGIGLERIAFNQGFYQSLLSHRKDMQRVGSSSGGAQKRANLGASADSKGGPKKKRKLN